MGDGGFGGFDAFNHHFLTIQGKEVFVPSVPKLTADKYVVKVELAGGAHGEVYVFNVYNMTLRPEPSISY
jgi:hypothetical protein